MTSLQSVDLDEKWIRSDRIRITFDFSILKTLNLLYKIQPYRGDLIWILYDNHIKGLI